jgi:hypothetical protein
LIRTFELPTGREILSGGWIDHRLRRKDFGLLENLGAVQWGTNRFGESAAATRHDQVQ